MKTWDKIDIAISLSEVSSYKTDFTKMSSISTSSLSLSIFTLRESIY